MDKRKGKSVRIFAEASTADGFISYINSVVAGLKKIYIIVGGSHQVKSEFLNKLAERVLNKGIFIEYVMCGMDHKLIDGIIIPSLKMAFIDGAHPHKYEVKYPGVVEEIINLGDCWDRELLEQKRKEIIDYTDQSLSVMEKGYRYLVTAREIHNHWESLYVKGLDYSKADKKADKVISEIFDNPLPRIRHLFASSISYDGPVNYINEITEDCTRRYILKGQPGTGKATLIKKVVKQAISKNYDVDIYHCALDPDKIDMVVIPQLKTAVIHGTVPHSINSDRIGDTIVDMLECIKPEILETIKDEAVKLEEEYEITQEQAIRAFKEANNLFKKLDDIYTDMIKKDLLKEMEKRLINIVEEGLIKLNNNNSL